MGRKRLRPLDDRVVVQPVEVDDFTEGGIIIPDQYKEKQNLGQVLAIGPGRYESGKSVPIRLKVGQIVLYPKHAGIQFDGQLILREGDVVAVVE